MSRPSLSKVSHYLVEAGVCKEPFTTTEYKKELHRHKFNYGYSLCDETFGRKSQMYLDCPNAEIKMEVSYFLKSKGVPVNFSYGRENSRTIEFGVSYFKGWHWDE